MPKIVRNPSSFRDPSGSVFIKEGIVYRKINYIYKNHFDYLLHSGLYDDLVKSEYLIKHKEVGLEAFSDSEVYKIIQPDFIPFISYPYEWSFSQLKDAAMLTLKIQKKALGYGMSLKDASAYNIQFKDCRPILIDTLSFEKYKDNQPWVAYRQFCQHFLSPLTLMAYKDVSLNRLLSIYLDGIPLRLASKLLPTRSYLNIQVLTHVHLHALSQRYFEDKTFSGKGATISLAAFKGLIDSLLNTINKLDWKSQNTPWTDYYKTSDYSVIALKNKEAIFKYFLKTINQKYLWDLGANTGRFSRIASDLGIKTVAIDNDPATIDILYRACKEEGKKLILPLIIDITNPSPDLGWENNERLSLINRGPADIISALALLHHLAISNNIPLENLSRFLSKLCRWLIVEFIPKNDSQIQKLLQRREDIFSQYTQKNFESVFSRNFILHKKIKVKDSKRVMYLFKNKSHKI